MYLIIFNEKIFATKPSHAVRDRSVETVWWPDDLPVPELGAPNPYPVSKEFSDKYWSQLRQFDYPPIEDLADAIVNDDEEALQKYKEACLAVKAKYPKPA